jgi:starvation-inducible DNA-binding protein
MSKSSPDSRLRVSAQPRLHQQGVEIQPYGTVRHALPLDLEEVVRLEVTERLNQLLADSFTLRDLYKKYHWQAAGPTFYQLHLLFDKHFSEQLDFRRGRLAESNT